MAAGADDYLVKPFSARELLARVEGRLDLQRMRREAQAALRESEARLSAVLQQLPVGLGVTDRNGRLTMSNAIMRAFAPENIPSRDPRQMSRWRAFDEAGNPIPPDEWPSARALRGQTISPGMEMIYTADDGGEIWTRVSSAPLRDEAGEIIGAIAVVEDVDERKRAEEALRRNEEHLELLSDSIPALIFYLDAQRRYRSVNAAFTNWFGVPREEVIGLTMREFVGEEAWAIICPHLERAYAGEAVEYEAEAPYRFGSDRWIRPVYTPHRDAEGRVVGVIALVTDITERKRAEEALRESEERFRNLADNMSQFAWVADAKGWIFWYNQRWYDYTGTTLEEMRGWGWKKVHHPHHVDRVVERIQHSWDTGEEWEDTFPLRGKDGNYRWFLSRAVPIRDAAGKIIRWFGTIPTSPNSGRQSRTRHSCPNWPNASGWPMTRMGLCGTWRDQPASICRSRAAASSKLTRPTTGVSCAAITAGAWSQSPASTEFRITARRPGARWRQGARSSTAIRKPTRARRHCTNRPTEKRASAPTSPCRSSAPGAGLRRSGPARKGRAIGRRANSRCSKP
jgi:PAS domain S-box-containing protein